MTPTDDRSDDASDDRSTIRVVALTSDLMDRSKLLAGFTDVEAVRLVAPRTLASADLLLVDLGLETALDAIDAAVVAGVRTIAYGSHVDTARLVDAAHAGAEAMPRSLFFRRLMAGTLLDADDDPPRR